MAARRAFAAACLACVLGVPAAAKTAPAPLPASDPAEVGMSAERLARIGTRMQHYVDESLVAGTVTLVARHGRVVHFEARGAADAGNGLPMTRDAIFRIASMTRPITSVALMLLWEEGRFQLHDPVAKYLPEFAATRVSMPASAGGRGGRLVPAETPITIRMLLTHTAGFAAGDDAHTASMQAPDGTTDDLAAFVRRLAALPLDHQPGTAWQYSHATDVVGRLVEVIAGQPLDAFLASRVLAPLGMVDTAFSYGPADAVRLTALYRPGDDGRIVLDDPAGGLSRWAMGPSSPRGCGGLAATAGDYARFAQFLLNGGELDGVRLLAPRTVSLMFENHTGDLPVSLGGPGTGFGLGFGVTVDRGRAASVLSNGSVWWGGAYGTTFWIDPEEELIAILMTQIRPHEHVNIRQDFQVLVYQALID
jgi:CubicO group peptidase (beta-lactamase class C family)